MLKTAFNSGFIDAMSVAKIKRLCYMWVAPHPPEKKDTFDKYLFHSSENYIPGKIKNKNKAFKILVNQQQRERSKYINPTHVLCYIEMCLSFQTMTHRMHEWTDEYRHERNTEYHFCWLINVKYS